MKRISIVPQSTQRSARTIDRSSTMRQAVIVICGMLLVVLTAGGGINPQSGASHNVQRNEGRVHEVVVRQGDSLWELAKQEGDSSKPTGRKVFAIQQFNQLDTSVIYPGQILRVPEGL